MQGVLGIESTFDGKAKVDTARGPVSPSFMNTPEAMKAIKDTGVSAGIGKG